MNDGDALLRAILAAPDDDAPRLVYADWLEERGLEWEAAGWRECWRSGSEDLFDLYGCGCGLWHVGKSNAKLKEADRG